jgi:hypothetical protein
MAVQMQVQDSPGVVCKVVLHFVGRDQLPANVTWQRLAVAGRDDTVVAYG